VRILFDQGTPAPLRRHLPGHQVLTAYECRWSAMKNGELLAAAEEAGFAVLVTTDSNLRYQQNLATRRIAIVVLRKSSWPRIQRNLPKVLEALERCEPGSYFEVEIA
jgi:hypothetical protein